MPNLLECAAFDMGDALFSAAIEAAGACTTAPAIVGLCGVQGSGKSTTAARIAGVLTAKGKSVVTLSLDDFYCTRTERLQLAASVHPLLKVRGVPGTHDVSLLRERLTALAAACPTQPVMLPRFDKAADDRVPPAQWQAIHERPDVVILEGWCVGARAQPEAALQTPVNALERDEDAAGEWRRYVNTRLLHDYTPLFDLLCLRLMLRAPSFDCVAAWRGEQEARLPRDGQGARPPMDSASLARFIAHYERISRWMMMDEPANLIADLDMARRPTGWRIKQACSVATPA